MLFIVNFRLIELLTFLFSIFGRASDYIEFFLLNFSVVVVTRLFYKRTIHFLGAPALTSRQFKEKDFVKVIDLLDRAVDIGLQAQQGTSKSLLSSKDLLIIGYTGLS